MKLLHQGLVIATATTFLFLKVPIWNTGDRSTTGTTISRTMVFVHAVSLPSSNLLSSRTGKSRRPAAADPSILLDEEMYTFEQFLSDFGRAYYDPIEYKMREHIFYTNLRTIVRHNQLQIMPLQQLPEEQEVSSERT